MTGCGKRAGGKVIMLSRWLKSSYKLKRKQCRTRLVLCNDPCCSVRGETSLSFVAEYQGRLVSLGGGVRCAAGMQARKAPVHAQTPGFKERAASRAINCTPRTAITTTTHHLDGGIRTPCQCERRLQSSAARRTAVGLPAKRLSFVSPWQTH
jgi:hypothetical protein